MFLIRSQPHNLWTSRDTCPLAHYFVTGLFCGVALGPLWVLAACDDGQDFSLLLSSEFPHKTNGDREGEKDAARPSGLSP